MRDHQTHCPDTLGTKQRGVNSMTRSVPRQNSPRSGVAPRRASAPPPPSRPAAPAARRCRSRWRWPGCSTAPVRGPAAMSPTARWQLKGHHRVSRGNALQALAHGSVIGGRSRTCIEDSPCATFAEQTVLGFCVRHITDGRQRQAIREWRRRRSAHDCSSRERTLQNRLVFFSRKPVREIWSSRGSIFCRGPDGGSSASRCLTLPLASSAG